MRRLAALAALAAPAAALPTLVYVVGVEGSGHHGAMLQLVWPLVRDRCGRACPPPRSRADLDDDGADAVYARASRCDSYAHDAAVAGALFGDAPDGRVGDPAALRRALAAAPPGAVFVESRSFPAGGAPLRDGPVDARRRPPLPLDLADLAAQLRGAAALRLVVLRRDFAAAVASHAKWDGDAHAALLAAHVEALAGQLEAVRAADPGAVAVLPVDCLYAPAGGAAARRAALAALAAFLGATNSSCCECLAFWRDAADRRGDAAPAAARRAAAAVARARGAAWGPFAPARNATWTYLVGGACR